MRVSTTNKIIILGICCILILLGSVWYANTFNNGRLVAPMDFSTYEFQIRDTPMIISFLLISVYIIFLLHQIIKSIIAKHINMKNGNMTRKLNPKLGLLGFLGFAGFLGFWTYSIDKTIFPFCFFIFFGFFGFFFEGKMSNTLKDERFNENLHRAQLAAHKIGFVLIWVVLFITVQGFFLTNLEHIAITLIISISLILALTLFLGEYLLYRYDHDEQSEE